MVGMPATDEAQVRRWAHAMASATDPASPQEAKDRAAEASRLLAKYVVNDVLPWKRSNPGDDLLSVLLEALDAGDLVSEDELVAQVTLLYIAGHETTVGLTSNAILTLLTHRTQLEQLVADPSLIGNAVEEVLRFETPIQFTWRVALEEIHVGDHVLSPGDLAYVCLAAANRDPQHFGADADVFDIRRPNASEAMAFGGGIHFCLGAALARREATAVVGAFFRRFPSAELAGDPERQPRVNFRSPFNVPVRLGR
jgi:cytochrome P450